MAAARDGSGATGGTGASAASERHDRKIASDAVGAAFGRPRSLRLDPAIKWRMALPADAVEHFFAFDRSSDRGRRS